METKDNQYKKQVADRFIENIGNVIRRHRQAKGYTLMNLSKDIGVTESTLSRYENGQVDIPASAMAYVAYVCDFDLSEYTIERSSEKKLSQIFKELVKAGEEVRVKRDTESSSNYAIPKYDRTDEHGNIIPTYPIRKPRGERIVAEYLPPLTDADDELFDEYMNSSWEGKQKVPLLLMVYHTLYASELSDIKDLKKAIRAITKVIVSDEDKGTRKMLTEYLKKCQRLNNG